MLKYLLWLKAPRFSENIARFSIYQSSIEAIVMVSRAILCHELRALVSTKIEI
jgi:hypothetical protein